MWLDWALVSTWFSLKHKMRSGKCRKHPSSGCVWVCVCVWGSILCGYISNNDSYHCWEGWYQASQLLRGVIILEWSGLRGQILTHTHTQKISFWHPSNGKWEKTGCIHMKISIYIIDFHPFYKLYTRDMHNSSNPTDDWMCLWWWVLCWFEMCSCCSWKSGHQQCFIMPSVWLPMPIGFCYTAPCRQISLELNNFNSGVISCPRFNRVTSFVPPGANRISR